MAKKELIKMISSYPTKEIKIRNHNNQLVTVESPITFFKYNIPEQRHSRAMPTKLKFKK